MYNIEEYISPIKGAKAYKVGECYVIAGDEAGIWHLSISHPDRYPSWDEIKFARYSLCPNNLTMVMPLPPKEEYVNVHENCFHLWEIKEEKKRSKIVLV